MRRVAEILAVVIVTVFLVLALSGDHPEQTVARAEVLENGREDTGARNLVTAVYLGYRAFDTLGETIVLLVSVAGVVYLLTRSGKS